MKIIKSINLGDGVLVGHRSPIKGIYCHVMDVYNNRVLEWALSHIYEVSPPLRLLILSLLGFMCVSMRVCLILVIWITSGPFQSPLMQSCRACLNLPVMYSPYSARD